MPSVTPILVFSSEQSFLSSSYELLRYSPSLLVKDKLGSWGFKQRILFPARFADLLAS